MSQTEVLLGRTRKSARDAAALPEDTILSVRGVSKKFCKKLRRSMAYGIADLSKNLLGMRPNTAIARKDEFWAVEDVSFELRKGDVMGLIGPNGSGKTTLLRLLAGIFPPDRGEIAIRGRVGALIALGAGFHQLMTGRENIYLNGTILGMTRDEIRAKFDDIVDFAEIGDFLDAPVSTYSSGMRVRLGFAIAISDQPDLLLIDEVIAVGDAGFRGKCYNAMARIASDAAIVFVSHMMPAIAKACSRCALMQHGRFIYDGTAATAIQQYLSLFQPQESVTTSAGVRLLSFSMAAPRDNGHFVTVTGAPLTLEVELESDVDVRNGSLHIDFLTRAGEFVAEWNSRMNGLPFDLPVGRRRLRVEIDKVGLNPGTYDVSLVVTSDNFVEHLLWVHCGWTLDVQGKWVAGAPCQFEGRMHVVDRGLSSHSQEDGA